MQFLQLFAWLNKARSKARFGLLLSACALASIQTASADSVSAAQSSSSAVPVSQWAEQVVLGSSTVELTGPWKFHKGDNLDWAQPEFNDTGWAAMDLTPLPGSYDPFLGSSGFVPGWTELGAAGYSGYAWYRLNVNVGTAESGAAKPDSGNQDAERC